MAECDTIKLLHSLCEADSGCKDVASAALRIVSDSQESGLLATDVHFLAMLLDELNRMHPELVDSLKAGTPDCAICAAVLKQLSRNNCK